MQVAENTILIIIFLLPGFFFISLLYQGTFEKTTLERSALWETAMLLAAASFFHAVSLLIISKYCPDWKINYQSLGIIFKTNEKLSEEARKSIICICTYNLVVWTWGALSGIFLRKAILELKWHRRIRFLRLANPWWYILNGETAFFKENEESYSLKVVDVTYVDILVKLVNQNVIYRGIMVDHFLKDGSLEAVSIKAVTRRILDHETDIKESKGDDSIFYLLPGNQLTIFAKDIVNINMTYVDFDLLTEMNPNTYSVAL